MVMRTYLNITFHVHCLSIYPAHVPCSIPFIILNVINVILFDDKYKSRRSITIASPAPTYFLPLRAKHRLKVF